MAYGKYGTVVHNHKGSNRQSSVSSLYTQSTGPRYQSSSNYSNTSYVTDVGSEREFRDPNAYNHIVTVSTRKNKQGQVVSVTNHNQGNNEYDGPSPDYNSASTYKKKSSRP